MQSFTWSELWAVRLVLESLVSKLSNEGCISLLTTIMSVGSCVGSRKLNLHAEILAILTH